MMIDARMDSPSCAARCSAQKLWRNVPLWATQRVWRDGGPRNPMPKHVTRSITCSDLTIGSPDHVVVWRVLLKEPVYNVCSTGC